MVKILNGHNIDVMRTMAPESVQVCVTSPPYYGLRDYKTPPVVWPRISAEGAHAVQENCEHEFVDEKVSAELRRGLGMEELGKRFRGGEKKAGKVPTIEAVCGFCHKCGAWRGHLGLEPTPEMYVEHLVEVFRAARRVLRKDGTLWLNLGDSYAGSGAGDKRQVPHMDGRENDCYVEHGRVAVQPGKNVPSNSTRRSSSDKSTLNHWKNGGRREEIEIPILSRVKDPDSKQASNASADFEGPRRSKRIPRGSGRWGDGDIAPTGDLKPKDLIGIPWMVAFALRKDGWYLRQRMPWIKRNPMPESTDDRPSTATEEIFLFSKSESYFYDGEAVKMASTDASLRRLSQDVESKIGSERGNGGGKTNGNMKAVGVASRSRRNSDWFFESFQGMLTIDDFPSPQSSPGGRGGGDHSLPLALVVNTAPFKDAHFATFPPKLVQPMILAGTSARGACEKCGAPWERIVESGAVDMEHRRACGSDAAGEYDGEATKDFASAGAQNASDAKRNILAGMMMKNTVGWMPTCKCGGYRVRSTSSRRIEGQARQSLAPPTNGKAGAEHDVESNTKFTKGSNAGRVSSLRDSARKRGAEYGMVILKTDALDADGTHHGQNNRRKESGTFSNDKRSRNEIGDSSTPLGMTRRKYYRLHWQVRVNARFPRTVPCTAFDPFGGSGTTAQVASENGRSAVIIDLSAEYCGLAEKRTNVTPGLALF